MVITKIVAVDRRTTASTTRQNLPERVHLAEPLGIEFEGVGVFGEWWLVWRHSLRELA
ncbi:MAG: hypothetical protein OXC83_02320 [Chloroflexi bacterium]|nr:hypothetical protein [Chloroflexota bacterium]